MTTHIKLVQNDTRPYVVVSLTDAATGSPIDVSNAGTTVRLYFRMTGSTTLKDTLVATKLAGTLLSDGTVSGTPTTPGAGGRVQFAWNSTSLNGAVGPYEGEIEITFNDGTVQTVYDLIRFDMRAGFN